MNILYILERFPPLIDAGISLTRYRNRPESVSMDDSTFLPQTIRLLDKAFGNGDVLEA